MDRRKLLKGIAVIGMSSFGKIDGQGINPGIAWRVIPSTGEKIPAIGMGSWLTFDVKGSERKMTNMKHVLDAFFKNGGRVIDSSPMYGSSEEVIGQLVTELGILQKLWISTKIWTHGKKSGQRQMNYSNTAFEGQVKVNHVHNIRDFKVHYDSLTEVKAKGEIRYIGITHYVNHAHDNLVDLIESFNLDFVQFNYNVKNPNAAIRLVPAAMDKGVATIVNRPFQTGHLFDLVKGKPLPEWVREWGINNWASFFLKYIIGHEGITCTVPATTQVPHVIENMDAGTGYLPTQSERLRMHTYFKSII